MTSFDLLAIIAFILLAMWIGFFPALGVIAAWLVITVLVSDL